MEPRAKLLGKADKFLAVLYPGIPLLLVRLALLFDFQHFAPDDFLAVQVLVVAQKIPGRVLGGQLEFQEGIQLGLELPVPSLDVLAGGIQDLGLPAVRIFDLGEREFQEGTRDDELLDDADQLVFQFFRFQPRPLAARTLPVGAVIVDMAFLYFRRDPAPAFRAQEQSGEREEMLLRAAFQASLE